MKPFWNKFGLLVNADVNASCCNPDKEYGLNCLELSLVQASGFSLLAFTPREAKVFCQTTAGTPRDRVVSGCAGLSPERRLCNPPPHNSGRKPGLVTRPAIEDEAQLASGAKCHLQVEATSQERRSPNSTVSPRGGLCLRLQLRKTFPHQSGALTPMIELECVPVSRSGKH